MCFQMALRNTQQKPKNMPHMPAETKCIWRKLRVALYRANSRQTYREHGKASNTKDLGSGLFTCILRLFLFRVSQTLFRERASIHSKQKRNKQTLINQTMYHDSYCKLQPRLHDQGSEGLIAIQYAISKWAEVSWGRGSWIAYTLRYARLLLLSQAPPEKRVNTTRSCNTACNIGTGEGRGSGVHRNP